VTRRKANLFGPMKAWASILTSLVYWCSFYRALDRLRVSIEVVGEWEEQKRVSHRFEFPLSSLSNLCNTLEHAQDVTSTLNYLSSSSNSLYASCKHLPEPHESFNFLFSSK